MQKQSLARLSHTWDESQSRAASCRSVKPAAGRQSNLYVGASLTSSNSTLAFSNRSSSYFKEVRAPWWVLAIVRPPPPGPPFTSVRSRAMPRAEPSPGSVPAGGFKGSHSKVGCVVRVPCPQDIAPNNISQCCPQPLPQRQPSAAPAPWHPPVPTSSSSTREREPLSIRSAEMRRRWPLKVDRLALRLCSSPISASTASKQGRRAGAAAGSGRPHLAATAARPSALREAVLPPVLGPARGGG